MKKARYYKSGGSIKGEPKSPKKTTIDRTKYQDVLSRPIEGINDNYVSDDPTAFTPAVLENSGYKYYSGTMGGKDIVYQKDGNYFLYNEQPKASQNKYGLVNIGNPFAAPKPVATPAVTPAKMPVNTNRQALNLNNPNMVYDPNTGSYSNPVTGTAIAPIVEQYKNGGKIKSKSLKGYAYGTDQYGVRTNNRYENAFTDANAQKSNEIQREQQRQNAAANTAKTLGAGAMAIGNSMYQDTGDYQLSKEEQQQQAMAKDSIDATAASVTPWYGLAKGASNIGKGMIKRDEYGTPMTGAGKAADDWLTPDHELMMNAYKTDGWKGVLRESSGAGKIGRSVANLTGNEGKTSGFWGKINKASGLTKKNQALTDFKAEEAANEAEAKRLEEAATFEGRMAELKARRDAGETGFDDDYFQQKDNAAENFVNPMFKNFQQNQESIIKPLTTGSLVDRGKTLWKVLRGKKDGGVIEGAGTAKSDSILANVEPGSFIVPAENADKAVKLRELVLSKPTRKANLHQNDGVHVRLSKGEHMFTPEEKEELMEKGHDLTELAPNADDSDDLKNGGPTSDKAREMLRDGFANGKKLSPSQKRYFSYLASKDKADGGMVKGYKKGGEVEGDFEKSELAKIEAQRKADARRYGEAVAKAKAEEAKRQMYLEIRSGLEKQLSDRKKAQANFEKNKREYDAIRASYEGYDMASAENLKRPKNPNDKYIGNVQNVNSEDVRREKENLLKILQDKKEAMDASKKELDFASNESNYIKDYTGKRGKTAAPSSVRDESIINIADKERERKAVSTVDPVLNEYTRTRKGSSSVPKSKLVQPVDNSMFSRDWAATNEGPEDVPTPVLEARIAEQNNSGGVYDQQVFDRDMQEAITRNAGTQPATTNPQPKFNWQSGLSSALNYGLPLAQTLIGARQLKKLGDRPVDELDPDYLRAISTQRGLVEQANQQAKFGLSAEEMAALNMQNDNLTSAGRYAARNYSGGSGAAALNAERSVINDSFGRNLSSKILDNQLKRQKQQEAYNRQQGLNDMLSHKQELNRRLFADTLSGWNQDQAAGSQLLGAGVQNLISANRYENERKAMEERNSMSNSWLNSLGR